MMTHGVELKQLNIRFVREPGQGVPVGALVRCQCPGDRLPNYARLHVGVVDDVAVIVIVKNERMPHGGTVEDQSSDREEEANCEVALPGRA